MNITSDLAAYISQRRYSDFGERTQQAAKHCLLDLIGVTIAGANEPLVRIMREQALDEGGNGQASLIAGAARTSTRQAALVNGSAAHAHDYDDVHPAMSGHPSVPVGPAVLALAEHRSMSGADLLQGLVTGIDAECIVGRYLGGSHYARGFHATGTLGTIGAAAGCANMLSLDVERTRHAIGIAVTQAAGLKSMFGSMCKPFHAGNAAANGLYAAQLAERGFTSHPDSLEVHQGFAATHADQASEDHFRAAMNNASFVPTTLFKYHAACYLTHSSLEAARALQQEHGFAADAIRRIRITVDEGHFSVCNIQEPATGLEAKFSLRFATAMLLSGLDTGNIAVFTDDIVQRHDLVSLRDRISVQAFPERSHPESLIEIDLEDGSRLSRDWNVAIPATDLDAQWQKLTTKFRSLVDPVLGSVVAAELVDMVEHIDEATDIEPFVALIAA